MTMRKFRFKHTCHDCGETQTYCYDVEHYNGFDAKAFMSCECGRHFYVSMQLKLEAIVCELELSHAQLAEAA